MQYRLMNFSPAVDIQSILDILCLYVCNGSLRGPVTFTLVAERLAIKLTLPVFTT